MPAQITPLLAERLDISEERARSLLQTMLSELRRRAETDSVRLPDLGTFREEDGRLTFEPSPSLRRRVNHQYEGLSAENLTPLATPPEAPPLSVSESATEDPPADRPEDEPIPTLDPMDEDDTATADAPPPEPEPEPSSRARALDSFSIITMILAFILLLGVGWFVLDRTNVWSPRPSPSPPVTQGPSSPDTADRQQTDRPPEDTAGAPDEPDTTAASAVRSWGIVVASRSSRAAAEATAEEYRRRFDSVEVIPGTVNDRTWYRVAIGWYESEAAAERALDEQASLLPSGAWTHRLR